MKKSMLIILAILTVSTVMAKKSTFTITFGSGGGVTGLKTTYSINSDRGFSKSDNLTHKVELLPTLKSKDITELRKLIGAVNFAILHINQSGNITSYITLVQDGKESKTEWTGSSSGNAAVDALQAKLVSLIPHK